MPYTRYGPIATLALMASVVFGFSRAATGEDKATIAYFQDFWPDDVYARWAEIDSR